jgi:hypothetical protein
LKYAQRRNFESFTAIAEKANSSYNRWSSVTFVCVISTTFGFNARSPPGKWREKQKQTHKIEPDKTKSTMVDCVEINWWEWVLRIEHWALSVEHWALRTERWALSVEHWVLSIERWALSVERWEMN